MKFQHLYIHVPFCKRKCHYCDFVSVAVTAEQAAAAGYDRLILQELTLWQTEAELGPWRTVYFGGGTPSLLPAAAVAEILAVLRQNQGFDTPEITLEANPESVNPEQLAAWRAAGVNRLSLGVQSFDDMFLRAMGRLHTASEARRAYAWARQAGFTNVSIDLIYGLPAQTLADWRRELAAALELAPAHISLYGLGLDEASPWAEQYRAGLLENVPDQDLSADMLELAMRELPAHGYGQYEIANFARPGCESRHNTAYWQRDNYLGLGVAAASCGGLTRWCNERDLAAYRAALAAGRLPRIEQEDLSIEEVLGEALFLGLRLRAGLDLAAFAARYGVRPEVYYRRPVARLVKAGLLEIVADRLRLTQRGLLLGNEVFMEFA